MSNATREKDQRARQRLHKPVTPEDEISVSPSKAENPLPFSEFLIPAADNHGHSDRVVVRLPPSMGHQLRLIAGGGKLPLEDTSAVARWCIYKGLQRLEEFVDDPRVSSLQALLNSWIQACQYEEEHATLSRTIEKVVVSVNSLVQNGHTERAQKMVKKISKDLGKIQDRYWRKKFQREISRKLGFLLRGDE